MSHPENNVDHQIFSFQSIQRHWLLSIFLKTVFQSFTSAPSLTPDDDVFKHLALTYAQNHPTMSRGLACKAGTPSFPNGITNGAAWYPLTGKFRQQFNKFKMNKWTLMNFKMVSIAFKVECKISTTSGMGVWK